MINRHPFDAILIALSAADRVNPHTFTDHLLPLAVEKQMGIIGMKIVARGRILSSWTPPPIEQQKNTFEGSTIATRPGALKHARSHALHPLASRQHRHPPATASRNSKKTYRSPASSPPCPRLR